MSNKKTKIPDKKKKICDVLFSALSPFNLKIITVNVQQNKLGLLTTKNDVADIFGRAT